MKDALPTTNENTSLCKITVYYSKERVNKSVCVTLWKNKCFSFTGKLEMGVNAEREHAK